MAIKNPRAKGAKYELDIARRFNSTGWNCVTSRSESKRTDDSGVDLCYTDPFQVQAKATEVAPNYHTVLASMPQSKRRINLLFHKRNRKGSIVAMTEDDFFRIVNMLFESEKFRDIQ